MIPEVVWTGGGGFSHSISGAGSVNFTDDIATIPAGVVSQDAPTLVAVTVDVTGSNNAGNHGMNVLLPDGTVLGVQRLTSGSLPGTPTGGMYIFALTDARLASGGTLRSTLHLLSVIAPDRGAGVVYGALLDLRQQPGEALSYVVQGGSVLVAGSTNPLPFTIDGDPRPAPAISLLGKTALSNVTIGLDFPGWEDVGQAQANGATAALATYVPVTPPTLSAAWFEDALTGGYWRAIEIVAVSLLTASQQRGRSYAQVVG